MKIVLDKQKISEALDLTSDVVSKKSLNPILQNVLLIARNSQLELNATDLEISTIIQMEAEVLEEGKITLLNTLFRDIIRAIPSKQLEITSEASGNVTIKAVGKSYQAKLHSMPWEEYPILNKEEVSNAPSFFIKGFVLQEMLEKNIPFALKDDARYTFNSVYLEKEKMEFRTIASDTKRLSFARTFLDSEVPDFNMLIPIKSAKIVKDFAKEKDIELKILPQKAAFICDNITLITSLIEGKFPDYKMVIPKETNFNILISKERFLETIKSLAPFLTGDLQKLYIGFGENKMTAYTEESELGKGETEMEIEFSGTPFEIAFNYRFLLDIMSCIQESEFWLKVFDPEKPSIFMGKDNDNFLFVTVPMKK